MNNLRKHLIFFTFFLFNVFFSQTDDKKPLIANFTYLLKAKINALSPLKILEKGYSVIYDENNNLTKTVGGVGTLLKDMQNMEISQTLDPGQEKKLGFEIELPKDADNKIQGLTTNFKVIFNAIQKDGSF